MGIGWTEKEVSYLLENYRTKTYEEIGNIIGRTKPSVRKKAKKLGLSKKVSSYDLIGERFGYLVVTSEDRRYGRKSWLCECDCGGSIVALTNSLTSGETKSCGCYSLMVLSRDNKKYLNGQRFGRLVVIEYSHNNKYRQSMWLCKCDCGNKTIVTGNALSSGTTKSCGNCRNLVNGVMVSSQQKKIAEMVKGVLNYKVQQEKCYIDVAILDSNIAIEYDSWFWHGYKLQQDKKRTIRLINYGWKVLRIKSNTDIPSKQQVESSLLALKNKNYAEIILSDWGHGRTAKDVYRI